MLAVISRPTVKTMRATFPGSTYKTQPCARPVGSNSRLGIASRIAQRLPCRIPKVTCQELVARTIQLYLGNSQHTGRPAGIRGLLVPRSSVYSNRLKCHSILCPSEPFAGRLKYILTSARGHSLLWYWPYACYILIKLGMSLSYGRSADSVAVCLGGCSMAPPLSSLVSDFCQILQKQKSVYVDEKLQEESR